MRRLCYILWIEPLFDGISKFLRSLKHRQYALLDANLLVSSGVAGRARSPTLSLKRPEAPEINGLALRESRLDDSHETVDDGFRLGLRKSRSVSNSINNVSLSHFLIPR